MPRRTWIAALLPALLLPACAEEAPPPEEAADAGLEQFTQAVDRMEEKKDRLEAQVEDLQAAFREQMGKHLTLLQERMGAFESRIDRLPAEREVEVRRAFQALQTQAQELRQLYERWSAASGAEATQLRQEIDAARQRLDDAMAEFEEQIPGIAPAE